MRGERGAATLDAASLRAVYAHAVEEYPRECCGVVAGGVVHRCANVQDALHRRDAERHARTSATGFAMGPEDVAWLVDALASHDTVVVYHSHPDVGAYFSDEDRRAAERDGRPVLDADHLVVDVGPSGVRGAALFSFVDDGYREVARFDGA